MFDRRKRATDVRLKDNGVDFLLLVFDRCKQIVNRRSTCYTLCALLARRHLRLVDSLFYDFLCFTLVLYSFETPTHIGSIRPANNLDRCSWRSGLHLLTVLIKHRTHTAITLATNNRSTWLERSLLDNDRRASTTALFDL